MLGVVSKAYLAVIGGMRSNYTAEAIRDATACDSPSRFPDTSEEGGSRKSNSSSTGGVGGGGGGGGSSSKVGYDLAAHLHAHEGQPLLMHGV